MLRNRKSTCKSCISFYLSVQGTNANEVTKWLTLIQKNSNKMWKYISRSLMKGFYGNLRTDPASDVV